MGEKLQLRGGQIDMVPLRVAKRGRAYQIPKPIDLRLIPAGALVWALAWIFSGQSPRWGVALGLVGASLLLGAGMSLLGEERVRDSWRQSAPARAPKAVTAAGTAAEVTLAAGDALGGDKVVVESGRRAVFPAGSIRGAVLLVAAALVLSGLALWVEGSAREADPVYQAVQRVRAAKKIPGNQLRITGWARGRLVGEAKPLSFGGRTQGELARAKVRLSEIELRGQRWPSRATVTVQAKGLLPAGKSLPVGSEIRVRVRIKEPKYTSDGMAILAASRPAQVLGPPGPIGQAVHWARSCLQPVVAELPAATRGLLLGMTLGQVSALPEQVRADMRAASLSHLTAVSGLHVGLVAGATLAILRSLAQLRAPLWWRRWRAESAGAARGWRGRSESDGRERGFLSRAQVPLTLLVMGAFALLVSSGASVLRATLMGGIGVLALAAKRRSNPLPALALAVMIMIWMRPGVAHEWGFALSVITTGGIITAGRALTRHLRRFLPRVVADPLAIAAAAQITCAPLLFMMTESLPLYGIPANLAVTLAVPPATLGGLGLLVGACLGLPHWLLALGAQLVALPAAWIVKAAHFFASLPGAQVPWIPGAAGAIGLVIMGICAYLAVGWTSRYIAARAHRWPRSFAPPPLRGQKDRLGNVETWRKERAKRAREKQAKKQREKARKAGRAAREDGGERPG